MTHTQHAGLTAERWATFTLDQQLLMIANEMNRAGKLFGAADRARLTGSYERVLRLADLTASMPHRPALRRELLRWRDLVAALYVSVEPREQEHRAVFRTLMTFTRGTSAVLW